MLEEVTSFIQCFQWQMLKSTEIPDLLGGGSGKKWILCFLHRKKMARMDVEVRNLPIFFSSVYLQTIDRRKESIIISLATETG